MYIDAIMSVQIKCEPKSGTMLARWYETEAEALAILKDFIQRHQSQGHKVERTGNEILVRDANGNEVAKYTWVRG